MKILLIAFGKPLLAALGVAGFGFVYRAAPDIDFNPPLAEEFEAPAPRVPPDLPPEEAPEPAPVVPEEE